MTTREILLAARERIAAGWTQGEQARDEDGIGCQPDAPCAVCWCPVGAMNASGALCHTAAFHPIFRVMRAAYFGVPVATWNDLPERTQKEVLAMMDAAIAEAR